MIYGVGTDLVKIERMQKSIASPSFVKRVFGEKELVLLAGRAEKHRLESAAACFAAKEAFLKACGVGLGSMPLSDIQALRRESGAPYYELSGEALDLCTRKHLTAHLSITHEDGLAMAFAVLEK